MRACLDPYNLEALGFRSGYYTKMKYTWVLQIGIGTNVQEFFVFSQVVYVVVVTRARVRMEDHIFNRYRVYMASHSSSESYY